VTGKLNIIEFLPFVVILWGATLTFGIVGAAAAWTLRCTVDALAMLWLSGMKKRDLLALLPPGALLAVALVISRFLGSSILENFAVAASVAAVAFAIGYLFSEEWRRLILEQSNRAYVFVGNLATRAKPIPPISTKVQK
jgi:hypothetical protein